MLYRIYEKSNVGPPRYTSQEEIAAQAAISGCNVSVTETTWKPLKATYTVQVDND